MLRVEALRVVLGGREVLHGVTLEAPAGQLTVVVGPSGSGKTTLLRAVAGLVEYEGHVVIGGVVVDAMPPWERGVAMVQQVPGLLPHMSILANVALAAELRRGLSRREAVEQARRLLEEVGLRGLEDRRPGELSGGQLQRAAIAAALATGAELLLLDEPLSHLDRLTAERLRGLLASLPARGATVLHVTHDLDEALALADRMVVLHGGRVEAQGDAEAVYRCPGSRRAAELLGHGIVEGAALGETGGLYSAAPDYVILHPSPGSPWVVTAAVRERGRLRLTARHTGGLGVLHSFHPATGGPPARPGERVEPELVAEPCRLEG